MISLKRKQTGFTIVELLIVIVVIGILAGLVITTFSGVQKKARDTERKTDLDVLHSHLERYYADNEVYPTLANLQDNTWISDNLEGIDLDTLGDPKGDGNDIVAAAAANGYAYAETPDGCDNVDTDCTGYTLTATLEDGGTHVENSLN